jgi:hypothetical protein
MRPASDVRAEATVAVPRVVKGFVIWSAALTVAQLMELSDVARPFRELVTPYTGWVGAMPYMFALAGAPVLYVRVRTAGVVRRYIRAQCIVLLLYVVFGVGDFAMFHNIRDASNPMLNYSLARPIWTVAIPIAWAIALWRARPSPERQVP